MLLRFLAVLGICVAILSGVLMGWVRYAQADPEYSCLSFDNITVQLDTSLYMRKYYPTQFISGDTDTYPTDTVDILVQTAFPHVNRRYPVLESMLYSYNPDSLGNSRLVLRDRARGTERVLEIFPGAVNFKGGVWSHDQRYFAYIWENAGETRFKIVDAQGTSKIEKIFKSVTLTFIRWTPDSHYFLFSHVSPDFNGSYNIIYTVNTWNWQYQTAESAAAYLYGSVSANYVVMQHADTLYIFDIMRQTFLPYRLPNANYSVRMRFSPDERYLALWHLETFGSSDVPKEYSLHILHISLDEISEIAGHQWKTLSVGNMEMPTWASQNSHYLYWMIRETGNDTALIQYDIHSQSTTIISKQITLGSIPRFIGNYVFLERSDRNKVIEVWDIERQEIVYRRRASQISVLSTENTLSWVVFELQVWDRTELYQLDLETLQEDMLFSSPSSHRVKVETNRINIIESANGLQRLISIDRSTKSTSIFTIPLAGFYEIKSASYYPREQLWYVVTKNLTDRRARVYQLELAENTIEEIASFVFEYYQDVTVSSLSPDGEFITVIFHDPTTRWRRFYAISVQNNIMYPLGTFLPGSPPTWTQCTY